MAPGPLFTQQNGCEGRIHSCDSTSDGIRGPEGVTHAEKVNADILLTESKQ